MDWILPASEKYYEVNQALKENKVVYWKQTVKYNIGDIVYIYCSKPIQRIMLKTCVISIDVPFEKTINDSQFYVNKNDYFKERKYNSVLLKLIEYVNTDELNLNNLIGHGLKGAPQGALRVKDKNLKLYIESIFSKNNNQNYEREVISIPATDTIDLINKYKIHAHPNIYRSYPYKKAIYYSFRGKYGVMDRMFSLAYNIVINPIELSELDELCLPTKVKDRITGYIEDRMKGIKFKTGDRYKFYILDKVLMLPKIVSLPGQNNHAYTTIAEMYSGNKIIKRYNFNISDYLEEGGETYYEGECKKVISNKYERNKEAREKCLEVHGYKCFVCGFEFEKFYGEIGKKIIDVHHRKPLYEIGENYKIDPISDLVPICPNCHRIVHSRKPCYTIEELKSMLKYEKEKINY